MSEKRFVVQEDVNTDKIILLIDYKRMKKYSFLAEVFATLMSDGFDVIVNGENLSELIKNE